MPRNRRTTRTDHAPARRHDNATLRSFVSTDEGFLLVEGYASRPGILEYVNDDGSIRRELVPREELARTDSLATLARKPVTLGHPEGEFVTPQNVDRLQVGDVAETVEVEELNGFVKIRMAVRKADAIQAIQRGVRELSVGYTVELDETPGEHPVFGRYDAIQKNRRYNHVAIVPQGRAGSVVGLRADEEVPPEVGPIIEAQAEAEAGLQALRAELDALRAELSALRDLIVPAAAETIAEELAEEVAEAVAEEEVESPREDRMAWFRARTDAVAVAERAGVRVTDAHTILAIKRAVVERALGKAPARTDAAYISAAFDLARARYDRKPAGALREVSPTKSERPEDIFRRNLTQQFKR